MSGTAAMRQLQLGSPGPFLFAETKKGSWVVNRGARGGWLTLDQRIEPSPPRAPPRSTMHIVDCGHLNGLMRLIDRSPRDTITLAPRCAIRQASCSRRDKTVHSATMSNGQTSAIVRRVCAREGRQRYRVIDARRASRSIGHVHGRVRRVVTSAAAVICNAPTRGLGSRMDRLYVRSRAARRRANRRVLSGAWRKTGRDDARRPRSCGRGRQAARRFRHSLRRHSRDRARKADADRGRGRNDCQLADHRAITHIDRHYGHRGTCVLVDTPRRPRQRRPRTSPRSLDVQAVRRRGPSGRRHLAPGRSRWHLA
jgi:hypothetical protein